MFKRIQQWANKERMAPEPYSFLPASDALPDDPPDPPTAGWWKDPLSSNEVTQRYFDGTVWTPYVCVRTAKSWTEIFPDGVNAEVNPDDIGIVRPPAIPASSPEPPTEGWWEDPIEPKLKQARYFDGEKWTDLVAPTKSAGPRLVTRRRDPKEVIQEQKAAKAEADAADPRVESTEGGWPRPQRGD